MSKSITIVGAGVVGLACASHLQMRGFAVTLIDPNPPGEGCSYGNAGCLSRASIVPVGLPGVWKSVPGYLLNPAGPFKIDWRYAHRAAPWLWQLHLATALRRVNAIADALQPLLDRSIWEWRNLANWAGVPELIRQDGYAIVYESETAFLKDKLGRELRQSRGVKLEVLKGGAITEFDPALSPKLTHMTWMPEQGHVPSPARLSRALAARLRAGGATFLEGAVSDFQFADGRVSSISTDRGPVATDGVVLAAGAFSQPLAKKLGSVVPLETERGYHVMLGATAVAPRIPVCSGEGKFFVTPMEDGLRVAGTVELAGLQRPPNYCRADVLAQGARRVVSGLNATITQRWMGHRPSLPDSLPVVGRSPCVPNAYFAFGHGHVGLTGAAPTGHAIARLVNNETSPFEISAFHAGRFC